MHEGKGKAYDKRDKGKAGEPKGERENVLGEKGKRESTKHRF